MNDFHPSIGHLGHEQTAALHHSGALGSETAINNVLHNSTSSSTPVAAAQTQQAAATGLGAYSTGGNKIKRHDFFSDE